MKSSRIPHNFTRSPVIEVFFSYTCQNGERKALSVYPPYPGWEKIGRDIRNLLLIEHEQMIRECSLQYTDQFILTAGEDPDLLQSMPIDPSWHIDRKEENRLEIRVKPIIPNTTGTINIRLNMKVPVITYIFTIITSPTVQITAEQTYTWCEEAHTEIHDLFDIIVPVRFIDMIR
ncbi:MAG TPA: hypothetical protein VN372_14395 [Methanospirillum sp.]|nr:hypothetical protein [Methanospirillum sp.]